MNYLHTFILFTLLFNNSKKVKVSKSDSQICKITLELGVGIDKKVSLLTYLSFYLHWEFHKVFYWTLYTSIAIHFWLSASTLSS